MKIMIRMAVLALALSATPAYAQVTSGVLNACSPVTGTFAVVAGKPVTAGWTVDALVPASGTDPTPVPARISGFYVQLDAQPRLDIGLPTPGAACPVGSPVAGQIPYTYRLTAGAVRGNHTITIRAYNFLLNPDGTPTTTRQESGSLIIPFVSTDLVAQGPPPTPKRGVIVK